MRSDENKSIWHMKQPWNSRRRVSGESPALELLVRVGCREYLGHYLSAHVDNELALHERRAADDHVNVCAHCHYRLIEQHRLKRLVRAYVGIVKAPPDLTRRIDKMLTESV